MNEWCKCNFCINPIWDACYWCDNYSEYKPCNDYIIKAAKNENISIEDAIKLIENSGN